ARPGQAPSLELAIRERERFGELRQHRKVLAKVRPSATQTTRRASSFAARERERTKRALARRIPERWMPFSSREVSSMTEGAPGCGASGRTKARKLLPQAVAVATGAGSRPF